MKEDKLTKILKTFGNRWVKANDDYLIFRGEKRKKRLLRWVTRKLFLEH